MYSNDTEPKQSEFYLDLNLDNNDIVTPKVVYNTKDILVLDGILTQSEATMLMNIIDNGFPFGTHSSNQKRHTRANIR